MTRTLTLLAALLLALPLLVAAKPFHADAPRITGGGWAENDNSGVGPPEQDLQFGFTAHALEEGEPAEGSPYEDIAVYTARGEFQARTVDPTTNQTLTQGHGDVVCIANLGPSSENEGGGDPDADVWEIRVSDYNEEAQQDLYGSFFVQDNGPRGTDYIDENFDVDGLLTAECGSTDQFQLEPVTRGQITVHD